jgi:hypothetical protein
MAPHPCLGKIVGLKLRLRSLFNEVRRMGFARGLIVEAFSRRACVVCTRRPTIREARAILQSMSD